jgi:hypothetical protein
MLHANFRLCSLLQKEELLVKIFVLLLAFSLSILAQTTNKVGSPEDQVVAGETQWLKAVSDGDTTVLKQILAENWIATTPGGDIVHQSDLAGSQSRLPLMRLTSHTVQFFGDTAVLMGQLAPEGQTADTFNVTAIFQRKSEEWQMIATHLSLRKMPDSGQ